jgi:hypothetical protein
MAQGALPAEGTAWRGYACYPRQTMQDCMAEVVAKYTQREGRAPAVLRMHPEDVPGQMPLLPLGTEVLAVGYVARRVVLAGGASAAVRT